MPRKNKPKLDHSDDPTYRGGLKKRSEALQIFWIVLGAVLIIGAILTVICFTFDTPLAGWITIGLGGALIIADIIYLICVYILTREDVKKDYYASSVRIEKYMEENKQKEEEKKKNGTLPKA